MSDFIFTIESEDEQNTPTEPPAKSKKTGQAKHQKKPKNGDQEPTLELNPHFLLDGLGLDPNSNTEQQSNRSKLLVSSSYIVDQFKEERSD
jgi:hypothetical protein